MGMTARGRSDVTLPRKGLRISAGNGEGVPPTLPPPIRRYLVVEIRLGKACDSYLLICHLFLNHYRHHTHTNCRIYSHLRVGTVRLENHGARDAPLSSLP
jgi:hypothetical protein